VQQMLDARYAIRTLLMRRCCPHNQPPANNEVEQDLT